LSSSSSSSNAALRALQQQHKKRRQAVDSFVKSVDNLYKLDNQLPDIFKLMASITSQLDSKDGEDAHSLGFQLKLELLAVAFMQRVKRRCKRMGRNDRKFVVSVLPEQELKERFKAGFILMRHVSASDSREKRRQLGKLSSALRRYGEMVMSSDKRAKQWRKAFHQKHSWPKAQELLLQFSQQLLRRLKAQHEERRLCTVPVLVHLQKAVASGSVDRAVSALGMAQEQQQPPAPLSKDKFDSDVFDESSSEALPPARKRRKIAATSSAEKQQQQQQQPEYEEDYEVGDMGGGGGDVSDMNNENKMMDDSESDRNVSRPSAALDLSGARRGMNDVVQDPLNAASAAADAMVSSRRRLTALVARLPR
jgi:hypothetical protein